MRFPIVAVVILVVVLFAGQASTRAAQPAVPLPVRLAGQHWLVQYSAQFGVQLWYDHVPVTRQSTLYLVKPGWSGVLYDQSTGTPVAAFAPVASDGSRSATITDQSPDAKIAYAITIGADNSVVVDMSYTLTHEDEGEIEYAAAYLNSALAAGTAYTADTSSGARVGVVPYTTPSTDQTANMFVPSFRRLLLHTRLGALTVAVSGDWPDFVCFDARRDPQSWAQDNPVFWMGLGVTPHAISYAGGRTMHVITRYQMTPPADVVSVASSTAITPNLLQLTTARAPQSARPIVIPSPKHETFSGGIMRINRYTRLVIADRASWQDRAAAAVIARELALRYSLPRVPVVAAASVKSLNNVVVIGTAGRMPLAARLLAKSGAVPSVHGEGYALRVAPNWAIVAGHDPSGEFYGVQTLCQLMGEDSVGPFLWGGAVDDYPSLSWRGAHLFVGNQALPFHQRLIQDVFARLKMNNLVLQCEQARWNTTGPAAPPWAMSKSDLQSEIAFANSQFMAVTPLIESVGHMEWLFANPSNLSLAEDPATPFAANAANPATDKFLFHLYDEVLDTFHSHYLHIGGDEVTLRGRYPFSSQSVYPTVAGAFTAQVTKLHAYLATKKVGTMMWGDMLLAPGETQDATSAPSLAQAEQMRSALPKDIVITDWHYTANGDFASPLKFQQAGYNRVIASTWATPSNIADFSRSAISDRLTGLLQTTWCGYVSSAQNLIDSPTQFSAFVLAAEYAWSGGRADPQQLPYNPSRVFTDVYNPLPIDPRSYEGFSVDLSRIANCAMKSGNGSGWNGYGDEHDLRNVPTGTVRLAGVCYNIKPEVLLTRGSLNPPGIACPQTVTFTIDRKAASLDLLAADLYSEVSGSQVGTVTVRYDDSSRVELPLIAGQNIAAWDEKTDCPNAPEVWQGQTTAGDPIVLRAITWTNPNPHKAIATVTVTENDPAAAPVLFAMTGVCQANSKGARKPAL